MINYDRLLEFCNVNSILVEEFFLMMSIYVRDEDNNDELARKMHMYYTSMPDLTNRSVDYVKMVNRLIDEEYIKYSDNLYDEIKLKYLSLTPKFKGILTVDPEDVWEKFVSLYPSEGIAPNGGVFKANKTTPQDKEYFIKYVIHRGDKFECDRVLYLVEEMFQNKTAEVGISKFIFNWNTISKEWENRNNKAGEGWNVTMV